MAERKLTNEQIAEIKQALAINKGPTQQALTRKYGVGKTTIQNIKKEWNYAARVENNKTAKLTDTQVRTIRRMLKLGKTPYNIAKHFKIDKAAVDRIYKGTTYKNVK